VAYRGNDFDVSSKFNTTDPRAVKDEIDRICLALYPSAPTTVLDIAFGDFTRLYRGEYPGYHACDTPYHDMQHVLDVTLAMARLIDGYERTPGTEPFGYPLFRLGVITALFHDVGYVRERNDRTSKNGAEYTRTHVSRGAQFLRDYLPKIGIPEVADIAAALIHFTGYETPVSQIEVPAPVYKLLGCILGSADIIAQMSDRCYLEKCRDRLYPEFVAGGLTTSRTPEGTEQVMYASAEDLVNKTPLFFEGASRRLEVDLGGCYKYAQKHFGGQDLYLEHLSKNISFAQEIGLERDGSRLKRKPPKTLETDS
jgi:hypothetical protein